MELEEAEYRAYLEREVGPLEKIVDLGEEAKVGDEICRREDEGSPVRSGERDAGKKKKKKKKGKVVDQRKETDQEFLIKCGALLVSVSRTKSSNNDIEFLVFAATYYIVVGSIAPPDAYLRTRRSPWELRPTMIQIIK